MKVLLIEILKILLKIIYAPIKLFKTKNRIVYLSRQSNDKSLDMKLLEEAINNECPNTEQVFRLKMIPESLPGKIAYCFSIIGDIVPNECLHKLDINNLPTEQNRVHTSKELAFCRRNREKIYKLALKTYSRVTKGTDILLKNNSCDFKLLEQAYTDYCKTNKI